MIRFVVSQFDFKYELSVIIEKGNKSYSWIYLRIYDRQLRKLRKYSSNLPPLMLYPED